MPKCTVQIKFSEYERERGGYSRLDKQLGNTKYRDANALATAHFTWFLGGLNEGLKALSDEYWQGEGSLTEAEQYY